MFKHKQIANSNTNQIYELHVSNISKSSQRVRNYLFIFAEGNNSTRY